MCCSDMLDVNAFDSRRRLTAAFLGTHSVLRNLKSGNRDRPPRIWEGHRLRPTLVRPVSQRSGRLRDRSKPGRDGRQLVWVERQPSWPGRGWGRFFRQRSRRPAARSRPWPDSRHRPPAKRHFRPIRPTGSRHLLQQTGSTPEPASPRPTMPIASQRLVDVHRNNHSTIIARRKRAESARTDRIWSRIVRRMVVVCARKTP